MLMIRLARFGAKKKPFYRVVVIEKERARDSRNLEVVGQYNPLTTPAQVKLNHERIEYWTKNGAQLSDTVGRLVKNNPAVRPLNSGRLSVDKGHRRQDRRRHQSRGAVV